jgi:hypothetical protein
MVQDAAKSTAKEQSSKKDKSFETEDQPSQKGTLFERKTSERVNAEKKVSSEIATSHYEIGRNSKDVLGHSKATSTTNGFTSDAAFAGTGTRQQKELAENKEEHEKVQQGSENTTDLNKVGKDYTHHVS